MGFNDGVKSTPIAYIGILSVLVTLIIVMMLQVAYLGHRDQLVGLEGLVTKPAVELSELTVKQQTALTKRALVDREHRIVTIGINRAMDLVVSELNQGKLPTEVIGVNRPAGGSSGGEAPAADAAAEPSTSDSAGDDPSPERGEGGDGDEI